VESEGKESDKRPGEHSEMKHTRSQSSYVFQEITDERAKGKGVMCRMEEDGGAYDIGTGVEVVIAVLSPSIKSGGMGPCIDLIYRTYKPPHLCQR
jgi:hypothetical protein